MASDTPLAPCPDCGSGERIITPEQRTNVPYEPGVAATAFAEAPASMAGDGGLILTLIGAVIDFLAWIFRMIARLFGRSQVKAVPKMIVYCPKCGAWEPISAKTPPASRGPA